MLRTFAALAVAVLITVACTPKGDSDTTADDFRKATIEQAKASFKKVYQSDLKEGDVKVVTAGELKTWLEETPWSARPLPCEIEQILEDPGNVDPSPIALDVSSSSTQGWRLLYVPIRSKVGCSDPKSDFFLDDTAACEESDKVMVCNGGIGGSCTCSCIFVCDAAPTDCELC